MSYPDKPLGHCPTSDRKYMRVRVPGHPIADAYGWLLEHRYMAWEAGMLTDPADHVHHKNHDGRDNRLENFEVLSRNEHAALHGEERKYVADDTILELYRRGMSTPEIQAQTGLDASCVYRRLCSLGEPIRGIGESLRVFQGEDRNLVEALLRKGVRARRVAAYMGTSDGPVRAVARECGIPSKRTGRPRDDEITVAQALMRIRLERAA